METHLLPILRQMAVGAVRNGRVMANNVSDFDFDDWDDMEDDEILYESEEYSEQYGFDADASQADVFDDLPV
ncbi:MAG: hypothetical protein HC802_22260, partial [Caldilineaceae bacterium]|nr:hypothetical protein [Caldilineaceae bacterium]